MNKHYKILLFLVIFSILYSLFFINIYQHPILGDGHHYYAYGVNLYKGRGYSYRESPPFTKSNLMEPGYPVFIYGLFKIFGVSKSAIQISQAILNGIIIMLTYSLANLVLNDKKKALIAAFLTTISSTIAGYASMVACEILATVFLMLLLLLLLMLLKEKKRNKAIGFAILAGFFCGFLVLTKMIYFLFPLLICLVLFIMSADKFLKYKAGIYIAIIFIGVLLPWLSFNNKIYGSPFSLSYRGGMAATIKAERLSWTPKEMFISFVYSISEGLAQRWFPREYKKVTYNPIEGSAPKAAFDKYYSLITRGYSEASADNQLRIDALNKIKRNILKYVILSISDFHYMLYFEGLPLSQFTDFFKRETRLAINAFFKIYSLLIIFFAVKGGFTMFRNKENAAIKAAFLLPVFYTLFIYSAIFGAPRYTFTIIPFIYILASVSIYDMVKARIPL